MMTNAFEVGARTPADWELAILGGHRMFRQLREHGGGSLTFDADQRVLAFTAPTDDGFSRS